MEIVKLFMWLIIAVVLAAIIVDVTLNDMLVADSKIPSVISAVLAFLILMTVIIVIAGVF